jgi:GT2 family glycosyltransferase
VSAIAISVVGYNNRKELEALLPSLIRAAERADAEITIVDNRSTDGTAEMLREIKHPIRVIRNPDRAGYGENHNLALEGTTAEYFVIMNPDMIVEEDVFVRLRDFMDAHPEAGIVTPKIVNEDGSVQGLNKRLPTVWDLFLRRLPSVIRKRFKRRLDFYEMRDVGYDAICDVPFVSGAFMFCRTEVLQRLGGFDRRYFLYFEDVDLSRRVARTHRTMYYPGTTVVHLWQRSAHKDLRFTWYFIVSGARYFLRWGIRWF